MEPKRATKRFKTVKLFVILSFIAALLVFIASAFFSFDELTTLILSCLAIALVCSIMTLILLVNFIIYLVKCRGARKVDIILTVVKKIGAMAILITVACLSLLILTEPAIYY